MTYSILLHSSATQAFHHCSYSMMYSSSLRVSAERENVKSLKAPRHNLVVRASQSFSKIPLQVHLKQHYSSYDHKGGVSEVAPPPSFISPSCSSCCLLADCDAFVGTYGIIALPSVCSPRGANAVPIWACAIFSRVRGATRGI